VTTKRSESVALSVASGVNVEMTSNINKFISSSVDSGGFRGRSAPLLGDGLTPSLIMATPSPVYLFKRVKHGTRNIQNDCHQWLSDSSIVRQIRFRPGLRPRRYWGSLQRSPDPIAGIRGSTFKGEGRGEKGKGRDRSFLCKFLDPPLARGDSVQQRCLLLQCHFCSFALLTSCSICLCLLSASQSSADVVFLQQRQTDSKSQEKMRAMLYLLIRKRRNS